MINKRFKRTMTSVLALSLMLSCAGCGKEDKGITTADTTTEITSETTEATTTEATEGTTAEATQEVTAEATTEATSESGADGSITAGETATEDDIKKLITENLRCMRDIFVLGNLPTVGDPIQDQIYEVDTSTFASYADLDSYVHSVYTNDTANMYMKDFPTEGEPEYLEVDGKLCVDMNKCGGKGYYVNWESYTIDITSNANGKCEFTVNATIEEPSDNPTAEPYPVSGTAVYEDGAWKLTTMLY